MKMFVPDGKGGREEWKIFRGDPGPQGDRGPKGDKGDKGEPGTTSWSGITDKPDKFTPDSHKHTMADISDLPPVDYKVVGGSLVKRHGNGAILVPDPATSDSATPKSYVDAEVGKKADATHTHSEYASRDDLRALIRLVDSAPASPEDGVLYVIPE